MARDRTGLRTQGLHKELVALAPQLRRYAYALTRNPADADDLVQATMERVLMKPMPEDAELAKWSYRVCRNMWIDEVRSRKVRREAAPEIEAAPHGEVSTEETVASRMALRKAQDGIAKLPD